MSKKNHDHSHEHHHDHHDHNHENHWLKAGLGLIWGAGLLALAIASLNIPVILYYVITGLTTLMTLYLGITVYQSAWRALLEKKWDSTTLYTISTLTIIAVSLASLFIPGLPMMFEAAPLVLGFWHLGEGIEHTLVGEINKKLDVRDCLPHKVLLKGQPDKIISVKKLQPGDSIVIKKGQAIPVDGIVLQEASLYTTRVNGSPKPKTFAPGETVQSGMVLTDKIDLLEMRVTQTYKDSYLSIIAKNNKKAINEKAPVEVFADTVLNYFIPGLLLIALISGIVVSSLFGPGMAILCVTSVLVSACPCALSLITPMAVKIGMKKASENGIRFNNGKALQAAADIDTLVFDLNGTLTQGKITVNALRIADKKFLNHVALLESRSNHPLAKIITSYIHDQGFIPGNSLQLSSVDISSNCGVKGIINGELFIIGNKKMLAANNITAIEPPYDNPANGATYIVRGTTVIGQIASTDPLREDALATVQQLKQLGKEVHICTGADKTTAENYAASLGIAKKHICANAVGAQSKPGEISKRDYIEQLRRQGRKVAMVGDAANDLNAITCADIGIAVKSSIGDIITERYAGIVVQQGLLFPIATAFDVAQKTKQNILQNLFVSLTYNSLITLVASGLFVAVGFALNPILGVALMVVESTIVLANLYRFKQQEIVLAATDCVTPASETLSTPTILRGLGYHPKPEVALSYSDDNTPSSLKFAGSGLKIRHSEHSEESPCIYAPA